MKLSLMKVLALLEGVPYLKHTSSLSWQTMMDHRGVCNPLEQFQMQQAIALGNAFANTITERGSWVAASEPDGYRITVHAYCLTHGELVDLLAKAFEAGQVDAMDKDLGIIK